MPLLTLTVAQIAWVAQQVGYIGQQGDIFASKAGLQSATGKNFSRFYTDDEVFDFKLRPIVSKRKLHSTP